MDLQVKVLDNAVSDYYTDYKQEHATDSGINLVVPKDILIKAGLNRNQLTDTVKTPIITSVGLGIACEPITHDQKPHGYYLYHRSSVSKSPVRLANHYGIIDYTYRGEIIAKVYNIGDIDYLLKAGTILFQLCSYDLSPMALKVVSELSNTSRGSSGFGSTGTSIYLTKTSK